MSLIVSRTPLRISLIGGSTDVPAFYEKHPGVCVSFAINKYVYIMVNDKFDGRYRVSYSRTENVENVFQIQHSLVRTVLTSHFGSGLFKNGLEIVSIADIPGEGSGLGSSSSFTVGLINALRNYDMKLEPMELEKAAIADAAFRIERKVNPNIGRQDHLAASFGGFNRMDFNGIKDKVHVIPIASPVGGPKPWSWNDLHENMLLLYTGFLRKSDDLLKSQKEGFDSGKTIEIGKSLAHEAGMLYAQLMEGNLPAAGRTMHAAWHLKRRLAPGISNEWVDEWYAKAMNNGAWGGKLCGAGGGGFVFFIAPPDTHDRIVKATGLRKIDFNIDHEGSVIIKREGYGEF